MRTSVWMLGTMLLLAGCSGRDILPRPPKHPEEIVAPPLAEAKFSNPPVYPEQANQNDQTRAQNGRGPGQPNLGAMNTGGMGGRGMGGMGMGGMGMGGMGMGGMGGMGR